MYEVCLNVVGNKVITVDADDYNLEDIGVEFVKDDARVALFDKHSIVYILHK